MLIRSSRSYVPFPFSGDEVVAWWWSKFAGISPVVRVCDGVNWWLRFSLVLTIVKVRNLAMKNRSFAD